jgi:dihydroorotate dehydrogenase
MTDYYRIVGPLLRLLDPEIAHRLALIALRRGVVPTAEAEAEADPRLRVGLWGMTFPNPVGLAAGFDKNAEVADAMLALGFGFVEVGTVTPRPQPGNPRPRVFRLAEHGALINRLGFNNAGMETVFRRLERRRSSGKLGIVGVNLGPNRESADPVDDCARATRRFAGVADYLVVNVSSPNTPGLRGLQSKKPLSRLLARVLAARDGAGSRSPLLVKVAPDLTAEERRDIVEVALAEGIDGLIATNTTVSRPASPGDSRACESGGLSGRPLFALSTAVLADLYRLSEGRLPIIGVGGIASGEDAYAKIRAGASLVQLYTALVYQGPGLVLRVCRDLAHRLRADGFASVAEAVGSGGRDAAGSRPLTPETAP